jgi:hypothetical protein
VLTDGDESLRRVALPAASCATLVVETQLAHVGQSGRYRCQI